MFTRKPQILYHVRLKANFIYFYVESSFCGGTCNFQIIYLGCIVRVIV